MVRFFSYISPNLCFSLIVGSLTSSLIAFLRFKMGDQFLLFDRLFPHGGWIQVVESFILSAWIAHRLLDRSTRPLLRKQLWMLFSIFFFVQLLLGIIVDSLFLMSGKLHFPIPSVILTGALFRSEFGFMPILFLATVLISGGAWCSYLCYFGSFDSWASGKGRHRSSQRQPYRIAFLTLFIFIALLLRFLNVSSLVSTLFATASGMIGVGIIVLLSMRRKSMIHCSYFCPMGTLVSLLRFLSPFRFRISTRCTRCMACTTSCPYGALSPQDIDNGKPSLNCTTCGDCMQKCRHNAFEYHFFSCSPATSERIFFACVALLYTLFINVARI